MTNINPLIEAARAAQRRRSDQVMSLFYYLGYYADDAPDILNNQQAKEGLILMGRSLLNDAVIRQNAVTIFDPFDIGAGVLVGRIVNALDRLRQPSTNQLARASALVDFREVHEWAGVRGQIRKVMQLARDIATRGNQENLISRIRGSTFTLHETASILRSQGIQLLEIEPPIGDNRLFRDLLVRDANGNRKYIELTFSVNLPKTGNTKANQMWLHFERVNQRITTNDEDEFFRLLLPVEIRSNQVFSAPARRRIRKMAASNIGFGRNFDDQRKLDWAEDNITFTEATDLRYIIP